MLCNLKAKGINKRWNKYALSIHYSNSIKYLCRNARILNRIPIKYNKCLFISSLAQRLPPLPNQNLSYIHPAICAMCGIMKWSPKENDGLFVAY